MRVIASSWRFVTQILPAPTAMSSEVAPIGICVGGLPGRIFVMLFVESLVTQTASSAKRTSSGSFGTSKLSTTELLLGSISTSCAGSVLSVTHTRPPPTPTPLGRPSS